MCPELSIIIITWNQYVILKQCLASLHEIMSYDNIEIIVSDNGSTDETVNFISSNYPKIKLILNESNKGVAFARNRGIELSTGKKILLLDNDTIANTSAIRGMSTYLDNHNQVGICGCRLIDASGKTQKSFKPFPSISIKIKNILGFNQDYAKIANEVVFPTYIIGACQMIKRDVIDKIGLLDEKIFYGPEDADFCIRSKNAGWDVAYLPQFSIIHLWQRATRRKLFSKLSLMHLKALIYFYIKHRRIFS